MPDNVPTPDLTEVERTHLIRYGGWDNFCRYYALNPFIPEEYRDAVNLLAILIDRDRP